MCSHYESVYCLSGSYWGKFRGCNGWRNSNELYNLFPRWEILIIWGNNLCQEPSAYCPVSLRTKNQVSFPSVLIKNPLKQWQCLLVRPCVRPHQQPKGLSHVNLIWLVCNPDYTAKCCFTNSLLFFLFIFAIALAFVDLACSHGQLWLWQWKGLMQIKV